MRCPKCGIEVEPGMKFCGECGTPIPQTKKCPKCGLELPLATKFCGECGYNFNATSSGGGSVIGDKNVIAGDVHIDQSSTVNNNTVNNITNTTTNIINQDETKKLVTCAVCGKQLAAVDAFTCPRCHKTVCVDHYDVQDGACVSCAESYKQDAANSYKIAFLNVMRTGVVGVKERNELSDIAAGLGLNAVSVSTIEKEAKSALGAVTTVHVSMSGLMIKIGRQPFRSMNDLDRVKGGQYSTPEACLDCSYLFNCYDSDLTATVNWRDRCGELCCLESSMFDENQEGVRFLNVGDAFGAIKGSAATLFISEASADSVIAKLDFDLCDEFDPKKLVVEYMVARFDNQINRVSAVRYDGRELKLEYVKNDSAADSLVNRSSWLCKGDDGYNYNINAYAPGGVVYNRFKVETEAAKVWTLMFEGEQAAAAFIDKARSSSSDVFASMSSMTDGRSHGIFLLAENMRIGRSRYGSSIFDPFMINAKEENGDFLGSLLDFDELMAVEEKIKAGAVALVCMEIRPARWEFDMYTVRDCDGADHFRIWEDILMEGKTRIAILNAIDCKSPSFGKSDGYLVPDDDSEEPEESCDEVKAQRDDVKIELTGDVVRRVIVLIKNQGRELIQL